MHTLCNCTWGSTQLKYTHTNEIKLNAVFRLLLYEVLLTHQGRAMHLCISKLTIIGSDNGLLLGQRQTMIWTNDGILLIWILGTNSSEILSKNHTFSFKKIHLKVSSVKWRPFCLRFNVSNQARASLRQWISGWCTFPTLVYQSSGARLHDLAAGRPVHNHWNGGAPYTPAKWNQIQLLTSKICFWVL